MNLFISSSKRELKVLFIVVCCVVAVEAVVWLHPNNSQLYDHSRDKDFQTISQSLGKARRQPRILVMGNSLVMAGVKAEGLAAELGQRRNKARPTVLCATWAGSAVTEWRYILRNYFSRKPRRPDLLVVCAIEYFLRDDVPLDLGRLPIVCRYEDYPRVAREDLSRFDERVELALNYLLPAFRYRSSVRHAVLAKFVPGYTENLQQLNNAGAGNKAGGGAAAAAPVDKYSRLRRLLKMIQRSKIPTLVIGMPQRDDKKPIDPEAIRLIREAGVKYQDCTAMAGLSPDKFKDFLHLNDAGGQLFTRQLSEIMMQQFPNYLSPPKRRRAPGPKPAGAPAPQPTPAQALKTAMNTGSGGKPTP